MLYVLHPLSTVGVGTPHNEDYPHNVKLYMFYSHNVTICKVAHTCTRTLKKLLVTFFRVISFPCKISSDYQDCGYFTC